ncbi:hypothetical protein NM208_g7446 [Fusarium decemcellulare]|uniref:Uncharacterized protein n=1 Tax=Fusarium decemcellulare TaxID=57161 RepID=A0ACC1S994_9HYPO|nr:hypothetical protein NM208_g7446 [Fusarium decemcellulare]
MVGAGDTGLSSHDGGVHLRGAGGVQHRDAHRVAIKRRDHCRRRRQVGRDRRQGATARGAGIGERKVEGNGRLRWREIWSEGTDAVMDIPLAGVCEVLYGEGREEDDEEDYRED